MADILTKSDLEQLLGEQTKVILGAVDEKFVKVEADIAVLQSDVRDTRSRLDKIEESIAHLADTLDAFLKRLTTHEEEFEILKSEMQTIKDVLKNKFQIDIDAIRHQ